MRLTLKKSGPAACAAAVLALIPCAFAQTSGGPFPAWTPGTLDIHHISTGRGNATFFVLPDGSTLLVDAGAITGGGPRHAPARPDASRSAGEWIARYIRHMTGAAELDHAMLTHFHSDHMGQITGSSPQSKSGAYKLSGITEVGEHLRIRKLLDRGWPDYGYPAPLDTTDMANYRAFLKWQSERNGMRVERFIPGRNDQIVLARDPKKYQGFEIRNLAANGEVWTGVGTETRQHFPPLETVPKSDWPSENMCSAGFRLSYGKFDYYTGGDIPGIPNEGFPEWHDVETSVAKAAGPVEAAVLDHHGYIDSMNAFLVGALRPRAWIFFVWDSAHPTHRVFNRLRSTRLYPGPRDIFANNMHPANKTVISGLEKITGERGHVVLRVALGGASFRVFLLDDTAETYRVTAIHGPYDCR